MRNILLISLASAIIMGGCKTNQEKNTSEEEDTRMRILIDSDANNELDDQHAIAYALFNGDVFNVVGITVNNTYNGDGIEGQYAEALRVANYNEIIGTIDQPDFDGVEAVDFIIAEANQHTAENPLILLPIGKLTNVALALAKAPEIKEKVKVKLLMGYILLNRQKRKLPTIKSRIHHLPQR